ncbi:hypothetical protein L6R52_34440 [Myxococcota bacterium]|nr:hypothetical protein [Myxococcota bacterium]
MSVRSTRSSPKPTTLQSPRRATKTTSAAPLAEAPAVEEADAFEATRPRTDAKPKKGDDREASVIVVRGTIELLGLAAALASKDGPLSKEDETRLASMGERLKKSLPDLERAVKKLESSKKKGESPLADLGAAAERFRNATYVRDGGRTDARSDELRTKLFSVATYADDGLTGARGARAERYTALAESLDAKGAGIAALHVKALSHRLAGETTLADLARLELHLVEGNAGRARETLGHLAWAISDNPHLPELERSVAALEAHGLRPPRTAAEVVAHGASLLDDGARRELEALSTRMRAARQGGNAQLRAARDGAQAAMFFNPFAMFAAPALESAANRAYQSARETEAEIMASPEGQRAIEHMKKLRTELLEGSALSAAEAATLASSVRVYSGFSAEDKKTITTAVADFLRITNGRGIASLEGFDPCAGGDRARATTERVGIVRVPTNVEPSIVWHEAGHHVEFESDRTRDVTAEWLKSQATSARPKPLKDIPPYLPYEPHEVAFEGPFAQSYGGRVYPGVDHRGREIIDSTEVTALGLERFASPEDMAWLHLNHPEHFYLVLGLIRP